MVDDDISVYPRTSRQAFGVEFDRLRPSLTFRSRRRINLGWVGFALVGIALLLAGV